MATSNHPKNPWIALAWSVLFSSALLQAGTNLYAPFPPAATITEGISWPKGQALPIFATPASPMDSIVVQDLNPDELITVSAIQGMVNRKQPRIYLLDSRAGEGRDTWAKTPTMNLSFRDPLPREKRYELIAKYANEFTGVVLYDPSLSPHYRNLAGTVAGQARALPMTPQVRDRMKEAGVDLKVIADLTTLKFTKPLEIYQHLFDSYWKNCEKRLIVSARPSERGDHHHTRDIAAAVGAAVVWLDPTIPAERDMLRKFFGDMKAGEAIALGWYTAERAGITTASEFGIGTLPADFFMSASVYSGTDHKIQIPAVPKMPDLENKVYVALFISDGDNIQYNQHAMRQVWDRTETIRGKMPLNWTIAPGLVDIAPGIMNYYYGHSTPNDCFVTGPSGMGYMMPCNTLNEPGAPIGEFTKDASKMDGYTRLTETYLQRSGIRVITIWDNASPMQRTSYEKHCRHLYGATVQNFKDVPSVRGGVENKRLPFDKLIIPYAGSKEHLGGSLNREIGRWNGKAPLFLSYQANIWGELKPDRLLEIHDELNQRFPNKVQFVRADHYFNLFNQLNGIPYNLSLSPKSTVKAGLGNPEPATDGTPVTMWSAQGNQNQWLGFDFGETHTIHRYVIRHAGDGGMSPDLNTRAFTVRASSDGKIWKNVDAITNNTRNVTDVDFPPVNARYVKITVQHPGKDGTARIADVEIFGK